VIRSEVACGGNALPWDDRNAFAKAMLAIDIDSYREARATGGPVVFDRGLPDLLGYRKLAGLPPCRPTEAAVRAWRYAPTVFIAPPWPAIYVSDAERRQSWQEAEATWAVMAAVYPACGYRLLELPRLPVAERVHFVRTAVGA
jgi:predicted ATPase